MRLPAFINLIARPNRFHVKPLPNKKTEIHDEIERHKHLPQMKSSEMTDAVPIFYVFTSMICSRSVALTS
jgi:hypothetical protein